MPQVIAAMPSPAPPVATYANIRMPLDAYLISHQGRTAIYRAIEVLTARCMRARGFSFPATAAAAASTSADVRPEPYGINDPAQAARYGYGDRPSAGDPRDGSTGERRGKHTRPWPAPQQSSAYWLALTGGVPSATSATASAHVPATITPGCIRAASAYVLRAGAASHHHIAVDLAGELAWKAMNDTARDARVASAENAWSACMAEQGFHYRTPGAAANARWPSQPGRAEIATARTDVACKHRVDLPGIWLAVEAGYENHLIAANAAGLRALSRFQAAAVRRAEQILLSRP
ncbi:MAG: hypothetical protein JOY82_11250 [Streptosporangiaceae bacterium]|nr:hypothetical protein [Streptosporangiaceae bacterium]MBV9855074.1 hypothetical protein [Streptosporangiaceae bacterium]